jgi:hypothetical protein
MSEAVEAMGFYTSCRGMSEAQWSAWASRAPAWVPSARHIVVVAPHPDDETLGAGASRSIVIGMSIPFKWRHDYRSL